MSRRKKPRQLTAEEKETWERVVKDTDPIRPQTPPQPMPPEENVVRVARRRVSPTVSAEALRPNPRPAESRINVQTASPILSTLARGTPGLDRNTAARLRKGRTEPQARIDLHGMSAQRAHGALNYFIQEASRTGKRCVLVITGKGGPPRDHVDFMSDTRGVLRSSTPRWLTTPPLANLVVGVYQAHPKHGGDGALYVYLKRKRQTGKTNGA